MAHKPPWVITPAADDRLALAAFAADRLWNGYSIADLAPPLRAHATVAVACTADAVPVAAVLLVRSPAFTVVIPTGDARAVRHLLVALPLPATSFVLVQPVHLPLIARHYTFPVPPTAMVRMAVGPATFRPPVAGEVPLTRLGLADVPALAALYASYPANAFHADQVVHGIFYGVRDGATLLAVGGTHVIAPKYGIAAVGSIYTEPVARGRGYARAITGAIVADLLAAGCSDVILNVAADNAAARRVYARLGFRPHCAYWEGAGEHHA